MTTAAETAAQTYITLRQQAGDGAARHATRAVLLQLDLLAHAPPKKRELAVRDIAQALVAQSTHESSVVAALLLEQAALVFRTARPPMARKYASYRSPLTSYLAPRTSHRSPRTSSAHRYAFHLILAGYRYISCSQRRHAVRAYASALQV